MIRFCVSFVLLLWATTLKAEETVLGLSQDQISIGVQYDGSDLLLFGAIQSDQHSPEDPVEVIITLAGPDMPVTIQRKSRNWGIWMYSASAPISSAPSFYAVASSSPLATSLSHTDDLRYKISIERAIRTVGAFHTTDGIDDYIDALIRLRMKEDLFQSLEGKVNILEDVLFQLKVDLPANIIEGDYPVRIFLTRNKQVLNVHETVISVRQVGLGRWLFNLSRQSPSLYALLAILLASLSGWAATKLFRLFRA